MILTVEDLCGIVIKRDEKQVFFLCSDFGYNEGLKETINIEKMKRGGGIMRTKITLACTECKQRNYNMTKDKKTHPDRMETKKYCRFCKTHTLHKETK